MSTGHSISPCRESKVFWQLANNFGNLGKLFCGNILVGNHAVILQKLIPPENCSVGNVCVVHGDARLQHEPWRPYPPKAHGASRTCPRHWPNKKPQKQGHSAQITWLCGSDFATWGVSAVFQRNTLQCVTATTSRVRRDGPVTRQLSIMAGVDGFCSPFLNQRPGSVPFQQPEKLGRPGVS